jgi:hypothetical protein
MSDDIVERLRSLSILDGWLPMMEEAAVEIDRQRKVISAMIEDCQYLKDKQIEAADEIEKLREALKPFALSEHKIERWFGMDIPDSYNVVSQWVTVGDLRAAHAAYSGEKND